jgi:RimJ/RimL family protein N-acetyltransferase
VPAPEELHDGSTRLRRFTVADAAVVAAAVRESLEHLAAWMPWADDRSATIAFQRERLRETERGYDDPRGSWEYAICADDGTFVGSCGLVVRDDGRREIGYWVHVDHVRRGHAGRAAALLTRVWREQRDEPRVEIRCDEANTASAAIARRLGYTLDAVVDDEPATSGESGRTMIWSQTRR